MIEMKETFMLSWNINFTNETVYVIFHIFDDEWARFISQPISYQVNASKGGDIHIVSLSF